MTKMDMFYEPDAANAKRGSNLPQSQKKKRR